MILKGTKDDDLTLKYLLENNKGGGGGGSGDVPQPAEANPLMDSVAYVGASDKYAREDHIHPRDTSRASQTDMTNVQGDISAIDAKIGTTALPTTAQTLTGAIDEIYNDHSSDGVIYLTNVPCSAMTGDFASVSNQYITSSHYVAECVFANPSYITSNVSWTTASGNLKLNGTCSAATTCNIVLVGPSNWSSAPPDVEAGQLTIAHANISAAENKAYYKYGRIVILRLTFTVSATISDSTAVLFTGAPTATYGIRAGLFHVETANYAQPARIGMDGDKVKNAYTAGGIKAGQYEGELVYIAND